MGRVIFFRKYIRYKILAKVDSDLAQKIFRQFKCEKFFSASCERRMLNAFHAIVAVMESTTTPCERNVSPSL